MELEIPKLSVYKKNGIIYDGYNGMMKESKLTYARKPDLPGEFKKIEIVVDGYNREYFLYIPQTIKENPSLVLSLHGITDSGEVARAFCGYKLDEYAEEKGFIVAYPSGFAGAWNVLRKVRDQGIPMTYTGINEINDVKFLKTIIDELKVKYSCQSVYMMGYSNGGQMTARMLVQAPEYLDGSMIMCSNLPIREKTKVNYDNVDIKPIIFVHGKDDPIIPYQGGNLEEGIIDLGVILSAEESVNVWTRHMKKPVYTEEIINKGKKFEMTKKIWDYNGIIIKHFAIKNMGHLIPNMATNFPVDVFGLKPDNFDAIDEFIDTYIK